MFHYILFSKKINILINFTDDSLAHVESEKFSSLRDPFATVDFALEIIPLSLIKPSSKFETAKEKNFGDCKIKEFAFTFDVASSSEVHKLPKFQQRQQLFYFVSKIYSKYNKHCLLYVKKWGTTKRNGEASLIAYVYCKFHNVCCLYKMVCKMGPEISVEIFKNKSHRTHIEGIQLTRQLRGPERELAKKDLAVQRACVVASKCHKNVDNDAAIGGRIDTFSEDVLLKARSETFCENRYHSDWRDDLRIMKEKNENISRIQLSPFSVYSHDDRVLKMVKFDQFEDTYHIDGTGQLVDFPEKQKRVMIYDVVGCHKKTQRKIPIAHMTSESHQGIDFSIWLQLFCFHFSRVFRTNFNGIAKRFVVDMSWALIYGIVSGINKHRSVAHYIEECFTVLRNNKRPDFVIVQICFAHFMKIASNFVKTFTQDDDVRMLFLNAMRAGAKLDNLDDSEKWFTSVVIVFGSQYSTDFLLANLRQLKDIIRQTNSETDDTDKNCPMDWEQVDFNIQENEFEDEFENDAEAEVEESSFSTMFKNILLASIRSIEQNDHHTSEANRFFISQHFCHKFSKKFIEAVPFPLWTNLMGKFCSGTNKTVSNAAVEGWFKNLKQYICGRMRDMLPPKFLRLRNEYLDGIVNLVTSTSHPQLYSSLKVFNKNINSAENAAESEEVWNSNYRPRTSTTVTAFRPR